MADVSNLDENDRIMEANDYRRMSGLANRLWHTDSSFKRIPANYSMLSGRVVPREGSDTEFADIRDAWDALPQKTKTRIENLNAVHPIYHSHATNRVPPFNPVAGRRRPPGHPALDRHPP